MEKLDDPRTLQYRFQPAATSPLEAFLNVGNSAGSASQPSSQSLSQPASQAADDLSQKFERAMQMFVERGDTDDFQKHLNEIVELSMSFHPEQRAFVKALEVTLDEFAEPEEKGGVPKEMIQDIVVHVKDSLDAGMQVTTDRRILQEILTMLNQLQQGVPSGSARRRRIRQTFDDDEEEAEDQPEQEGEDDDDVYEDGAPSSSAAIPDVLQPYTNAKFLDGKRKTVMDGLGAERESNEKTLKKFLDKVRDKRGYDWSFVSGKLKESGNQDSMMVQSAVTQKMVPDPITRGKITDPVRSVKCTGRHIYERSTLTQMVKQQRAGQPGMKCSYLGCDKRILLADIVEDEDYARFLTRSVVGTSDGNGEDSDE